MLPDLLRLTPLAVVADPAAAVRPFVGVGAEVVAPRDAACLGLRLAGGSGVIFTTRDDLAADFGAAVADRLVGRPILYAHVRDAEAAVAHGRFHRVAAATTRGGTREIVCDDGETVVILAEKVAA